MCVCVCVCVFLCLCLLQIASEKERATCVLPRSRCSFVMDVLSPLWCALVSLCFDAESMLLSISVILIAEQDLVELFADFDFDCLMRVLFLLS